MISFAGFPYTDAIKLDTEISFTIEIIHDYQKSYTKEIKNNDDNETILNIIREVRAFLSMYKDDKEIHLCNFIEFLIWFDKKSDGIFYNEIAGSIHECIAYAVKIDFIILFIRHKEEIEKYKLENLIDTFFDADISIYNDPSLIDCFKELCDMYGLSFKEKMIYILKRYVNDTVLNIIENNFNELMNEDLIHIIQYSQHVDEIKNEYKRMCVIKDIVSELIKE